MGTTIPGEDTCESFRLHGLSQAGLSPHSRLHPVCLCLGTVTSIVPYWISHWDIRQPTEDCPHCGTDSLSPLQSYSLSHIHSVSNTDVYSQNKPTMTERSWLLREPPHLAV